MSHKDGRVTLLAWVDPVLRDYAREAARESGLTFSEWVARAVQQTMARESADRAMALAGEGGGGQAMSAPLLPCPFCGQEPHIDADSYGFTRVRCAAWFHTVEVGPAGRDKAIEEWNRRIVPKSPSMLIDGYDFVAAKPSPRPAVVMCHACAGCGQPTPTDDPLCFRCSAVTP